MEDALTLGLFAAYAGLVLLDFIAPGRAFPKVRFWRLKGFLFFAMSLTLFMTLPFVWDEWLGQYRLFDLTKLGIALGSIVAIAVAQLFSYIWHRSMHNVDFLWRWFHQMHHSAERVDVFGAFYFSPLDVVGFAFVGSFALVLCVGVRPESALIANTFITFCSMFQHANLRTPRWLGYLIQRPESHALHHQRGQHAYNYGDIAFWDIVFGTFRNPSEWHGEAGFYDGASSRVGAMLLGRNVAAPAEAEPARPSTPAPAQSAA